MASRFSGTEVPFVIEDRVLVWDDLARDEDERDKRFVPLVRIDQSVLTEFPGLGIKLIRICWGDTEEDEFLLGLLLPEGRAAQSSSGRLLCGYYRIEGGPRPVRIRVEPCGPGWLEARSD